MQISVSYSHSPVFWATDNTSVRKLGSFTSLHWPLKDNRGLISFSAICFTLDGSSCTTMSPLQFSLLKLMYFVLMMVA